MSETTIIEYPFIDFSNAYLLPINSTNTGQITPISSPGFWLNDQMVISEIKISGNNETTGLPNVTILHSRTVTKTRQNLSSNKLTYVISGDLSAAFEGSGEGRELALTAYMNSSRSMFYVIKNITWQPFWKFSFQIDININTV